MKKRIAALMLAASTLALTSCGTTTSMDIDYNVEDYVTLGQYQGLEVTVTGDYDVTEEDITAAEDDLIASNIPYVQTEDTTVSEDSIVNVDYVGKQDGVEFSGGSASDVNIDVAGNADADSDSAYVDGFTSGLVGAQVGSTIDCDVTFPEDYSNSDLAGQTVVFTFTINYVESKVTVDNITDAQVADHFTDEGLTTVQELYDYAKSTAEESAETTKASDIRSAVISKVQETCSVNAFPEGMVEKRLEEYEAQYEATYVTDGSTLEDYLSETYGVTLDTFEETITESLESNLTVEMLFEAIAKQEGIELDDEGFQEYCDNLVSQAGVSEIADLYSVYGSTDAAGEAYLEKMYVCNKACDYCVDSAVVTISTEESS